MFLIIFTKTLFFIGYTNRGKIKVGKSWNFLKIRREAKKVAKSCKKVEKVGYSNYSHLTSPPMDIPQTVQFVDEAVCTKTGKRLNDLQRRIIAGILKNQKYADVSETHGYSAQHVKKVSHELLQMLSDIFGEQVKKGNLESVLERQINLNITFGDDNKINKNIIGIGCINNNPESSTPNPDENQPETPDFHGNNQANIEKIGKLRQFGLSDEQIAEVLELPLDVVQQVDFEE